MAPKLPYFEGGRKNGNHHVGQTMSFFCFDGSSHTCLVGKIHAILLLRLTSGLCLVGNYYASVIDLWAILKVANFVLVHFFFP